MTTNYENYKRRSATDYRDLFFRLAPRGLALARVTGTRLFNVLWAFGAEFARIDGRIKDTLEEADWRTTTELLADWERVAGLPYSSCADPPESVSGRQAMLHAHMTARGGQSASYLVDRAETLTGTTDITIDDALFIADRNVAGDKLLDTPGTFVVNAPSLVETLFTADTSVAGDPLVDTQDGGLECLINRLKPANTIAKFKYGS